MFLRTARVFRRLNNLNVGVLQQSVRALNSRYSSTSTGPNSSPASSFVYDSFVHSIPNPLPKTMKSLCFMGRGNLEIKEKPVPTPGPLEALIKVTATTICGSDVHIMHGNLPVPVGRTIGHEPVGVIAALGNSITGYNIGQRVLVGAVTPCGTCNACQQGNSSQCGNSNNGGWRLGNTNDGSQAQYMIVPFAQYNLAPVPDSISDTEALVCPDIMSTGFAGPEIAGVKIGDAVAVYAQGPVGLCATVAARLMGATRIIGVGSNPYRLEMARRCGCDETVNYRTADPPAEVRKLTAGVGADVTVEACGIQTTFDNCLKSTKAGGGMANLGVFGQDIKIDHEAYGFAIADKQIYTSLCPGGKERMRRMMNVLEAGRAPALKEMVTHYYHFDDILEAYDLFANQRDNVIKVALFPHGAPKSHKHLLSKINKKK
eukprot:gb/GEZN01004675.1/.p1 GENE.gb/GEZN01004675.1/~~gb/GEZN01004675.1/.p1  ORF type:complete len:430 (+),score=31.25 gb/GEZN01004675.1/:191-1480(+)